MANRLLFLVLSAVHRVDAVEQLARALAPHTVLIHHDFAQTPDFRIEAPNVRFVPQPRRTGWAVWGFTEAIFHSIDFALKECPFEYLQLLSPTCLPIKPLAEFEQYALGGEAEAHFGYVDLSQDIDALMTVGWRLYSAEGSLQHRILRRISTEYYRSNEVRLDMQGIQLRCHNPAIVRPIGMRARISRTVLRAASRGFFGPHPFNSTFRPCFGSTWFGARREVVSWILERYRQPDVQHYFPQIHVADEFLVPSLLHMSGARRGPMNHLVREFVNANPGWMQEDDIPRLQTAPAWFARKFIDDPDAPVRQRVIRELVQPRAEHCPQEAGVTA